MSKFIDSSYIQTLNKYWPPGKSTLESDEPKIISFIKDKQVIRKILEHLHLWNETEKERPPPRAGPVLQVPTQHDAKSMNNEPFDDDWPGYEEPYFTYE